MAVSAPTNRHRAWRIGLLAVVGSCLGVYLLDLQGPTEEYPGEVVDSRTDIEQRPPGKHTAFAPSHSVTRVLITTPVLSFWSNSGAAGHVKVRLTRGWITGHYYVRSVR